MKRTYAQGWNDIFGKNLPKKAKAPETGTPATKPKADQPIRPPTSQSQFIDSADIDWKKTRALSIRQPWAELIMQERKEKEYRSTATKVRVRIAIYASLGRYAQHEEEELESEYGLSIEDLRRGVIMGTVELYDCVYDQECGDYGWCLRDPLRLAEPIKPTEHPQPIWFYPFGRD